jgi:putative CocE/NonD family hydrolase
MRDGCTLAATLYLPARQAAPSPAILTMTPYTADQLHGIASDFATHGLPFLVVDVRGRGNSEGLFQPFIQEAKDGCDVVEWLAKQPCCDGNVSMWGGSYLGYSQWVTAKEFPPHLSTIVPTAAPYPGVDYPMRNNIFYPHLLQWLALTEGRSARTLFASDSTFWATFYRRWHESGQRFKDMNAALKLSPTIFAEWLLHPEPDGYWDSQSPTAEQLARMQIPILTITGAYDVDQPGALEHYRQHMRHASAAARAAHYLVIGPWNHAGTHMPTASFGGLTLGAASLIDMLKLHRQWYAWTMQGGSKPEFLRKPVAYYVTGAEQWRYANSLEEVTGRYRELFLDSTRNANDVFASGSLEPLPGAGAPDAYIYDPRDTPYPDVEAEAHTTGDSLIDQHVVFGLSGKQLVYHSAPFERDTDVSGFFRLAVWISIDCPDTDLYVAIYEIALDGTSLLLSTDALRARYRNGLRAPDLITTRSPLLYSFDRFTFVSRQIKRGHRLRLVIAPMGLLIGSIFTQRNFNGGGIVADESAADARAVTVRLFHDRDHPSALHVPLDQMTEE